MPALRVLVVLVLFASSVHAAEPEPKRQPKVFAIVYNHGYSGDNLPTDKEQFEALVKSAKSAHFNVILCQYEEWRAKICKTHGMLILVDLLVPAHHVYKAPENAKKLCESLKGNEVVYGYHLWSDNITDATVAGRTRDIANVHEWDPTHPAYTGTAYVNRINRVEGMDVFGYYDFHWKKGGHWDHLNKTLAIATAKKIGFLRYDDATSGQVGKGNANRVGYTFATSVPFGMKGIIYHYAGDVLDKKTFVLTPLGEDLKKVNARFAAVGDEVMKLGLPHAVYSTHVTKNAKNEPIEKTLPAGLTSVQKDHWFTISGGEVLTGLFTDSDKRDTFVFANHNPHESQDARLTFETAPKAVEFFDRAAKKWLSLKLDGKSVSFKVEDHGIELVRVTR